LLSFVFLLLSLKNSRPLFFDTVGWVTGVTSDW